MDIDINGESDDDLEYVDPPVSPSQKRRNATPEAIPDVGSESDDELEYVDPPVVSRLDEDEIPEYYKRGEGTRTSPICL